MWANPVILAGALVFGGIIAIAAAYMNHRNRRQQYYKARPERPNLGPEPPRILGPCGMCEGDVTILNGYELPCNHPFHYTCTNVISLEFKNVPFNWSDVCKHCTRVRINNNRESRNIKRERILGRCGTCEGDVTNRDYYESSCSHYFHSNCAHAISSRYKGIQFDWHDVCKNCLNARIKKNLNSRKNDGLRHRSVPKPNQQNCADCGLEIGEQADSRLLDCNRHKVHETCWEQMEASGLTTCSMCMEESSIAE